MLNIKNTTDGYLKDIEIKGNTIQDASNLADIRSVGDKVEGQELYKIDVVSCGKNLFDGNEFDPRTSTSQYSYIDGILTMSCDGQAHRRLDYTLPNTLIHGKRYILTANVKVLECSSDYTPGRYFGYGFYNAGSATHYGFFDASSNTIKLEFIYNEQGENVIGFHNDSEKGLTKLQWSNIQLEEGTVVTPYEPYQEHKLTILSPVQLEKVGDVRDRIICKDGVWGVEKNVENLVLDGSESWVLSTSADNAVRFVLNDLTNIKYSELIATIPTYMNSTNFTPSLIEFGISSRNNNSGFNFHIEKTKLNTVDSTGFKEWLKTNPVTVKYQLAEPQFIPLPHDQQVKLRTFAGQTNIHFETEIQGTIKAQVPKSIGATVNTHTEQIGNLSKELDRVKKLEENTVSTVVTESDFTTVEETSNGYFEDVKLEGRMLANLVKDGNVEKNIGISMSTKAQYDYLYKLSPNTTYTIIYNINNKTDDNYYNIEISNFNDKGTYRSNNKTGGMFSITTQDSTLTSLTCYYLSNAVGGTGSIRNIIVLEGDHTQNPPSYFEGLMSVGQDVEEVSVESVSENLFDITKHDTLKDSGDYIEITSASNHFVEYKLLPNTEYLLCFDKYGGNSCWVAIEVEGYPYVNNNNMNFCKTYRTDINGILQISIRANGIANIGNKIKNIMLTQGTTPKPYTPHQSNKKPLLYYNNETQTWEKPILRQWDSIEKHADGKYYYHKRSGEVVLNGSESWRLESKEFLLTTEIGHKKGVGEVVCDIIPYKETSYANSPNNIYAIKSGNTYGIVVRFDEKTNVTDFKQWLQANPTTVVYQLAQEEVYECTNIDLITYEGETNYVVSSGAITPKSTLKVHNNISNVVKILQEKVNLLESNVIASQEVQDMMILETDMRMLDIELALMEYMPITLNLGENTMLRSATYFNFLKNHIVNETYSKDYLENVMNKYIATGRINQDEYDELYKLLYPPVYDIELPIEY